MKLKLELILYPTRADDVVYKLYGLTPEEISIVEGKN